MHTPPNPKIALVLGANGRLGAAAVQAFAAAGWRVLAQARRTPAALPAGAVHVALDVADTAGLAAAAAGARVVVHALNPLYTRWASRRAAADAPGAGTWRSAWAPPSCCRATCTTSARRCRRC